MAKRTSTKKEQVITSYSSSLNTSIDEVVFLIQKTIDMIESHPNHLYTLEELAQNAFLSKYHYHKIFRAMVGEPVMEYIRKRRLTKAAQELMHTEKRLIDIGLEYGYEHHPSFTRSFKNVFGITPDEYRQTGKNLTLYEKVHLPGRLFDISKKTLITGPEVVQLPEIRLIGLQCSTTVKENLHHGIAKRLWMEFRHRVPEFSGENIQISRPIGIVFQKVPDHFQYMVGLPIRNYNRIPSGMAEVILAPMTYAVFKYCGTPDSANIYHTVRYLFLHWLHATHYKTYPDFRFLDQVNYFKAPDGIRMDLTLYLPIFEPKSLYGIHFNNL